MVLYFTGTGNSLYVAKKLDDARFSIPKMIHNENQEYTADRIGIVCPVYGHEMPELVKEFIRKATFHTEYFTGWNKNGIDLKLTPGYTIQKTS